MPGCLAEPTNPAAFAHCFTLGNDGVTINSLGVPGRTAIGRHGGPPARFIRLRPEVGQVAGTPGFREVGIYDRDTVDPRSQEEVLIPRAANLTGFLSASYDHDAPGGAEV